ncbi:MAG: DUF6941 family protein [Tepidiformaceae bacterium]
MYYTLTNEAPMTDYTPLGVAIDALFLANSAEIPPNGLVYVMGGAWSRCWPPPDLDYPYQRPIHTVAIFRVPWHETNSQHAFKISVEDEDNRSLSSGEGSFKAGRQPDLTDGASQVVVVVLPLVATLEKPGIYSVSAEIDGHPVKRIQFEALLDPSKQTGLARPR